jgi:hypothetical protein
MTGTAERERDQIGESQIAAPTVEVTTALPLAQYRYHLQIDDLGRGETLAPESSPSPVPVRAIVGQSGREDASVDDDHRPSRSRRMAAAASTRGTSPPERPPARSKTSSKVGLLASSVKRPRRYS